MPDRPLSPHLQVYRPQLTSVLSILHRVTGVFLAVGGVFVVYWLQALASGPEAFADAQALLASWFGKVLLLGLAAATCYHLLNGIRHLAWDAGWGFELAAVYRTGWTVVALTAVATAAAALLLFGGAR